MNAKWNQRVSKRTTLTVSLVVVVIALLAALIVPAVRQAQEAAREMECRNKIKQIGLGLLNFHDTFSRFPPAQLEGHSWRVRLNPFMISSQFYELYRFEEPWNSAGNHELERVDASSPYWFAESLWQCPNDHETQSPHTNYLMLVGPHAAGRKEEGISLADITDDPATTILVAEVASHDTEWLEPKDLDVETMSFRINDPTKPSISSHDPHGPHVVFCDGSVGQLGPDLPPEVLRAMTTIDGGEKIVRDESAPGGYRLVGAAEPDPEKDS